MEREWIKQYRVIGPEIDDYVQVSGRNILNTGPHLYQWRRLPFRTLKAHCESKGWTLKKIPG